MRVARAVVCAFAMAVLVCPGAQGQSRRLTPEETGAPKGNIVIRVRSGGAPLKVAAIIRLFSETRAIEFTAPTRDMGQASFNLVPLGNYRLEISAPGYATYSEEISVFLENTTTTLHVELRSEEVKASSRNGTMVPGPPLLTPKAKRELEAAIAALQKNDTVTAESHLHRLKKFAPGHPDAYYVWGLLHIMRQNLSDARSNFEIALRLYPNHMPALTMLGRLFVVQGENQPAISTLQNLLRLKPDSVAANEAIAGAYLNLGQFEQARQHADRALNVSQGASSEAQFVLAGALAGLGEREKAREMYERFLRAFPIHRLAEAAKRKLAEIQAAPAKDTPPPNGSRPEERSASAVAIVEPRSIPPVFAYGLPTVDEAVPVFEPGVACSLPAVLTVTRRHAEMLVENLQKISVTEVIEEVELNTTQGRRYKDRSKFNLVVAITPSAPGNFFLEEFRQMLEAPRQDPDYRPAVVSQGLGALALLFHPLYAEDYEFRCEGLTRLNGRAAWSVYFRQRPERPPRIRAFGVESQRYYVGIKGRAWVDAADFQFLRLETNIVQSISEIRLEHEHVAVDYAPVEFPARQLRFWLPSTLDLYVVFRGKSIHQRHRFTDYLLFSVDVREKIGAPKQPNER
jgi:tetratricopeptide (TPR) repeat protein